MNIATLKHWAAPRAALKPLRVLHPRRLSSYSREILLACYYRCLYGRDIPFAAELSATIAALEKYQGRGDIPVPREDWEAQYAGAEWDYLADAQEQRRYQAIAGYIRRFKPGGSILDVGCGKGLLLAQLDAADYSEYLGIDIARTAIDQAAQGAPPHSSFAQADAQTYVPPGRFDTIVFNEILYYFEDPLRAVERYEGALGGEGIFIASLYEKSKRAAAISRRLKRRYKSHAHLKISGNSGGWMIDVFAPIPQGNFAGPTTRGGAG